MSENVVQTESLGFFTLHHDQTSVVSARSDVKFQWFDPDCESLHAQPVQTGGRGAAWFVDLGIQQGVLRHYRRGGLISRLTKTLYVWSGLSKTRSFQEFYLMHQLQNLGLPVPTVMAAQVQRVGFFFYKAALITERIDGARALAECEDPELWYAAGILIQTMHALGVWHADLNVHNILVDSQGALWLIDFDRAQYPVYDSSRLQSNIERLERSVLKVCPDKHESHWRMLCQGYATDGPRA